MKLEPEQTDGQPPFRQPWFGEESKSNSSSTKVTGQHTKLTRNLDYIRHDGDVLQLVAGVYT